MKNENATPTMKHDGQLSVPQGGPAFPDPGRAQSAKQRELLGNPGMSLRDYFAAKAMPMCMTADDSARTVAALAYSMADAMLAERNK